MLVEMFASWNCIGIFDIFSAVIKLNVEWCFGVSDLPTYWMLQI